VFETTAKSMLCMYMLPFHSRFDDMRVDVLQREAQAAHMRHADEVSDLQAQLVLAQQEAAAAVEALERHRAEQVRNAEQLRAAVVDSQQVHRRLPPVTLLCRRSTRCNPVGCSESCVQSVNMTHAQQLC
jgi:hypothetical protein